MEDAPLKPDPSPVRKALEQLEAESGWFLGDTPDDMVAARRAGMLPIGVVAPGDNPDESSKSLHEAGAATVLSAAEAIEEILP